MTTGNLYICTPGKEDEFIYIGYSTDVDVSMGFRKDQLGEGTEITHVSKTFQDPAHVKMMLFAAMKENYGLYPGIRGKMVKVTLPLWIKTLNKAEKLFP